MMQKGGGVRLTGVSDSNQLTAIEQIHSSGKQLLLAVTGGGSGAISALLEVPGASASVLGAIVPYAQTALTNWLGGPVDQACSERTARAMAMRAFELACGFSSVDVHLLRGIGVTASLASNRPKRGPHRVHVAWQSADATVAISCELEKGASDRAEEERIATRLALDAVAEACDVRAAPLTEPVVRDKIERREWSAEAAWSDLLLGARSFVMVPAMGAPSPVVLFPGAFNPFHEGHRQMVEVAAARVGAPVTLELSIANVDKPPLDFLEISDRLASLTSYRVLLTRASTFAEKAQLAPGCVFVVGVDTLERIAEPRYYHNDAVERDAAVASIAESGCRFLVFGRQQGERFETLSSMDIPAALRALCDEVPEALFRADVSSSQLRSQ
jgi:nicotinamide mononucleotide (NMN) deamidase PncC